MDRQFLLNQAWETVDEIRRRPEFQTYREAEEALFADPELSRLVSDFARAQADLEPLRNQGGPHHPDWKAKSEALARAKDALYSRPEHHRYREAEKKLNALLAVLSKNLQSVLDECAIAKKTPCQGR
jgi:cell fate (sporulation/competence/biofilm development) regulator YlbF (YheA/YmcA/DUF963 family)